MLVARRLAELRQLTRKLQRVSREAAIVSADHGHHRQQSDVAVKAAETGAAVVLTSSRQVPRGANSPHDTHAQLKSVREKILFRRAPISVSLLERSLYALDRHMERTAARQQGAGGGATVELAPPLALEVALNEGAKGTGEREQHRTGPSRALVERTPSLSLEPQRDAAHVQRRPPLTRHAELATATMSLLYVLEEERRALLAEEAYGASRRVRRAERALADFKQEFSGTRRSRKTRAAHISDAAEPAAGGGEDQALLNDAEARLKEQLHLAREDQQLLRRSLLSRPLLSARMWRLLLAERIWIGAVQLQKASDATSPAPSHSTGSKRYSLLYSSLLLSRLALGTVKDYVDGAEISKHSPRFVVSLPSAAFRQAPRRRPTSANSTPPDPKGKDHPESDIDDLTALMFGEPTTTDEAPRVSASTALATPPSPQPNSISPLQGRRPSASLRWVPPHSAHVRPLLLDTLALISFVLPELDCAALARAGLAEEVASLLTSIQKLATTTLILADGIGANAGRDTGAAQQQQLSHERLHDTLRRLERGMLAAGQALVEACAAQLRAESGSREGSAGVAKKSQLFSFLSPAKAVRLVAELDALHLLDAAASTDSDASVLLEALVLAMFPELRTNTLRKLMERSRQSSLLGFATKQHRAKLYKQHGGRTGAERFVLGTVIQRARLEQRRMASALREQHLTNTHLQFVTALARAVPPHELIAVFRVLAVASASASHERGGERTLSCLTVRNSRTTAAALFLAEALLTSDAFSEAAPGREQPEAAGLNMNDLVQLWTTLVMLWPVVDTRRELLLQQQRANGRGAPVPGSSSLLTAPDVKTETVIMSFATEMVLTSINSAVAQHVRHSTTTRAGGEEARMPPAAAVHALSAEHLAALALGVIAWHEADPMVRRHRSFAVSEQVQLMQKLMREVMLGDVGMWREIRAWDLDKRAAFERRMLECFRAADLLDNATTRAVERACSTV